MAGVTVHQSARPTVAASNALAIVVDAHLASLSRNRYVGPHFQSKLRIRSEPFVSNTSVRIVLKIQLHRVVLDPENISAVTSSAVPVAIAVAAVATS